MQGRWVPCSRLGVRHFGLACAVSRRRRPPRFDPRVHPLVRFVPLQSSPSLACPRPPGRERLPWGSLPLRDINRWSPPRPDLRRTEPRASQARSVPPSTFLTSSTACSSTDLRGFVSPHSHVRDSLFRVFPSRGAARGSPRRCPRVGSPPPPARLPERQKRPRRLQGLALRVSPSRDVVV